eukprot:CAMPEP_0203676794 /NCGR_PEP_ID=MMETSP0090-20130426/25792_1 /ASSEMBLY_ACC=CAM_ASM_001088 /TAXON_ID=426623 /ORGANISM="Chaetoceros affinis, Strain CCMP159" /LENGTH=320 /DNA_ID=CAMNT_0050543459 /DNA_START=56 /DNA_END=1018 /DNA_ORIENTATION=+
MGVGYIYSRSQQEHSDGTCATTSSSESGSTSRAAAAPRNQNQGQMRDWIGSHPMPQFLSCDTRHLCNDYCSCHASQLQEELECLRESTKNALFQSWDEVESLNKKCASQEQSIASLKEQLEESLKREEELERKYEKSMKELKELNNLGGQDHGGKSMKRSQSSGNNRLTSLVLDFTNHSAPAHLSQFLMGRPLNNKSSHSDYHSHHSRAISNKSYNSESHHIIDSESKHSSTVFSVISTDDALEISDEDFILRGDADDCGQSRKSVTRSSRDEIVDDLKEKLESREREISALENVIVENMKTFQELHAQLEQNEDEKTEG